MRGDERGSGGPTYLPQPHLSAHLKSHTHHVQIWSHVLKRKQPVDGAVKL